MTELVDKVNALADAAQLVYQLGPVEPGSLIVIDEAVCEMTDDGYDELPQQLLHMIKGAVGHDRFVVIRAPHGTNPIDIVGPSEAHGALAVLAGTPDPVELCRAVVWLQERVDAAVQGQPLARYPEGMGAVIKAAHDRMREDPPT